MSLRERYEVDASQPERALKSLKKAQAELGTEVDQTGKKLTKAEREARKFAEQAEPTKRVERNFRQLAAAVKQGRVSLEDAQKIALKYQQRMEGTSKAGEAAFGAGPMRNLGSYISGLVSVSAAVGGVRAVFQAVSEEAEAAQVRVRESLNAIGELQQLSDFAGNRELVKSLVKRGVASDASQAAGIVFQLSSSGIRGEDRDFLLNEVAANKLVSPENLALFAAKVKKAQDTLKLGSFSDAVNKVLAASGAVDTDATSMAEAATLFGSQLTALGFQGDAGLAAFSTITTAAPNQRVAATQLAALLTQIDKKKLKQGGLAQTVASIQQRVAAGEDLGNILPNTRAVSGFRNLSQFFGGFQDLTAGIARAPQDNLVAQRGAEIQRDPTLRAGLLADEARGAADVAVEEAFSRGASLIEAALQKRRGFVASTRSGAALGVERLGQTLFRGLAPFAGQDAAIESLLREERGFEAVAGGQGAFSPEFEAELRVYLSRQADALERIEARGAISGE